MAINIADSFNRTTAQPPFTGIIFADLTARDAYATTLRYEGMECYVISESMYYSLVGGTDNADWIEREGGSGSGVVAVADIAARNAIPEEDRALGMIVQVQTIADYDGPVSFQLVGGITNADWVIFDDILVFPAMSDLVASSPALHKLGIRAFIINLNLVYVLTLSGWSAEVTQDNNVTITNKDIDGGTASNTSRSTIPRAATIEAAAALTRKKGSILYNDFSDKILKDIGTGLKSIPDFGDVNIFAQEIAADNVIGSWTQNLSGITATFAKGTDSRLGTCYKLDITSASSGTGGTYTVRKDFAVPEAFRGTFVELSYDYVSTVSKTGTCVILYDVTNSVVIVPQTDIQAQPDPTSLVTKGFITFSIPSTCETLRVFIGRAVDASAIAISNQYFYFNNLQLKKFTQAIAITEGPKSHIRFGNGGNRGSTNTQVVYFTDLAEQSGTGLTYVNTAALGTEIHVKRAGILTVSTTRNQPVAAVGAQITRNVSTYSLSTPTINVIAGYGGSSGAGVQLQASGQTRVVAGDIIRLVAENNSSATNVQNTFSATLFEDNLAARYADYTQNQDVSFVGFRAASQAASTTVNVKVDSVKDTVGAWDAVNGEYEVKSAGDTDIEMTAQTSTSGGAFVYKNGTNTGYFIGASWGANGVISGSVTIPNCIVGDKLSIRLNASFNLTNTYLSFSKRATSQQLFAPIAQRYVVKTYQSGTSWYEVYSDGWVKQGFRVLKSASATVVSLVIQMKDTNYSPQISTINATGVNDEGSMNTFTTSGFTITSASTGHTLSVLTEGYGNAVAVKALGANPNYA